MVNSEKLHLLVPDTAMLGWLSALPQEHQAVAAKMNRLVPSSPLAKAWRSYVATDRVYLYDSSALGPSYEGEISTVLCVPRNSLALRTTKPGKPDWLHQFDVLGIRSPHGQQISATVEYFDVRSLGIGTDISEVSVHSLVEKQCYSVGWKSFPSSRYSKEWVHLASTFSGSKMGLPSWIHKLAMPLRLHLERANRNENQRHGISSIELGTLIGSLEPFESVLANSVVAHYVKYLDPVAVSVCMLQRMMLCPEEYNWIAGSSNPVQRKWRADALRVMPGLSLAAAELRARSCVRPVKTNGSRDYQATYDHRCSDHDLVEEFVRTVDAGSPLVKTLAKSLGVRPVAVRALHGVSTRTAPVFANPRLGWTDILETLNAIPPERYPKGIGEWRAFSELYRSCTEIFSALLQLHPTTASAFLHNTARPWLGQCSRDWVGSAGLWVSGMDGLQNFSAASTIVGEVQALTMQSQCSSKQRYRAYKVLSSLPCSQWRSLIHTLGGSELTSSTHWSEIFGQGDVALMVMT